VCELGEWAVRNCKVIPYDMSSAMKVAKIMMMELIGLLHLGVFLGSKAGSDFGRQVGEVDCVGLQDGEGHFVISRLYSKDFIFERGLILVVEAIF